jgi:hypothetical protein
MPSLWPLYRGFFVDINLFKSNKGRDLMALKSIDNASENDGRGEKDGLADDDANLMIKMKFLTYKVILGWKVFWLEGFVICCNFLALSLHYHPDVGHVFIFFTVENLFDP